MLTRKWSNLLLSVALALSLLVLIGATYNARSTDASAKVMKSKVLRRKAQIKLKPSALEILGAQQGDQERTFEMRDFKDLPLAVRQVRNLQSDTWHKDLEIEVKNNSTKPIYSILAYLEFPDEPVRGDGVSGIVIIFGERKYVDLRRIGDSQDPHLNPGDTYVFTIPEKLKKGLKVKHEKSPKAFKRLELRFGVISFGDGTGFEAEEFSDYRAIKLSVVT